MPFVTEEIWQHLKFADKSVMISDYPQENKAEQDEKAEHSIGLIMNVITTIRNIRGEMGISPSKKLKAIIHASQEVHRDILFQGTDYVINLANLEGLTIAMDGEEPKGAATGVLSDLRIFVLLDGTVDINGEKVRLAKEIAKISKDLVFVAKKLANRDFLAKAAEAVVKKEEEKYRELMTKHSAMEAALKKFQELDELSHSASAIN
jgi:valyl-tRNA synthetase